ncbi:MAG TPA: caspase family protein [Dongiaceae bacterium]|nr:caspase family protein [Dongiaceae bacterium]
MIYARLIGIDAYASNTLYGCNNDVTNMAAFLAALGVSVQPPLRDGAADAGSILNILLADVGRLNAGDQLIVHFSGHGSQRYFQGITRAAACPIDFRDGDRDSWIIDLDLGTLTQALVRGARVTIFADCCFSGGLEQNFVQVLGGALKRTMLGFAARVGLAASPRVRVRAFARSNAAPSLSLTGAIGTGDVVVLAASGFGQESGEHDFGGSGPAGIQGVFTHFLIQRLSGGNIGEAATATCAGINTLAHGNFTQVAELHGNSASWNRPLIEVANTLAPAARTAVH